VDTNAGQAAASIDSLRDSIAHSKDAIKEHASALRNLRGDTDQIKAAKDQLRAKLEAEKQALSASTLKLVQQGAAYEKVKTQAKDAAKEAQREAEAEKKAAEAAKKQKEALTKSGEAMDSALDGAGGPVASIKGKLDALTETLGGTEGGMAAVAGAAALGAAAVVGLEAAVGALTAKLSKFIVVEADAARMAKLTRQANLAGNASWAKNLGDQVDELARHVPLAKDKINELGLSLARSRIGGQTMVDTMKAVAGATAAAGDDLGNKLKGLVSRGAFTRRFQLSPQELLGMDLDFSDVAKAYAQGMHVSVDKARQALFEGRVRLADGAAALKRAVETKFGAINSAKLLGLDNQLQTFKQDLAGLAKDADIEPVLKSIQKLEENFSQTNVNGRAMKHMFETLGKSIGLTFEQGTPIVQDFVDKAVYGALRLENYWLRSKIALKGVFGKDTKVEWLAFSTVASAVASPLVLMARSLETGAKAASLAGENIGLLSDEVRKIKKDTEEAFGLEGWEELGANVVKGLAKGVLSGADPLLASIGTLGEDVKKAFAGALGIHSPSKVFEEYGRQTTAGFEKGVHGSAPAAAAATAAMAPVQSASSAPNSRASLTIHFNPQITIQGGVDAKAQLSDPSLLQPMTDQLLAAIRAAGIEVAT
jgi:hypothetical protein